MPACQPEMRDELVCLREGVFTDPRVDTRAPSEAAGCLLITSRRLEPRNAHLHKLVTLAKDFHLVFSLQ